MGRERLRFSSNKLGLDFDVTVHLDRIGRAEKAVPLYYKTVYPQSFFLVGFITQLDELLNTKSRELKSIKTRMVKPRIIKHEVDNCKVTNS